MDDSAPPNKSLLVGLCGTMWEQEVHQNNHVHLVTWISLNLNLVQQSSLSLHSVVKVVNIYPVSVKKT